MRRASICLLVAIWSCTISFAQSATTPFPVVVATINLTNQTAPIDDTTIVTPTKDTTYRIPGYITASGYSGAWSFLVDWTNLALEKDLFKQAFSLRA